MPALVKLKREGRTRAVGITGLPFKALKYVLGKAEPGSIDIILSYCKSNLQNGELESDMLPFLNKRKEDTGEGEG